MKLEFSHHFHARHCTVLTGAVPKECRPYLRKTVLPGRRDFGNFPFKVRHCSVSTKPLLELDLFAIWGKSWVLNNLCIVVHPNECSEPAACESFEPTCALGSKIGPMAPTLLSPDTSIFFAQTKQAVVGSEKNYPRSYENTVTQRNAPFLDTHSINYNIRNDDY